MGVHAVQRWHRNNRAGTVRVSYNNANGNIFIRTFWAGTDAPLPGEGNVSFGSNTGIVGYHTKLDEIEPDGTIVTSSTQFIQLDPYVKYVASGVIHRCINNPAWWYHADNEFGAPPRDPSNPGQFNWGTLVHNGGAVEFLADYYAIAAPFVAWGAIIFALSGAPGGGPQKLIASSGSLRNPIAEWALAGNAGSCMVTTDTDGTIWLYDDDSGGVIYHLSLDAAAGQFKQIKQYAASGAHPNGFDTFGYFCNGYVAFSYSSFIPSSISIAKIQDEWPWPIVATIFPYAVGAGASPSLIGPLYPLYNGLAEPGIYNGQGLAFGQDGVFSLCQVGSNKVPVADILRDISLEAGLSLDEMDFSGVPDLTWGFAIAQQMPYRNAIQILRDGYFIDFVERDGKLVGVKRGSEPVVTIPDTDLAGYVAGSEPPPLVELVRMQESELPRSVTVNYFNHGADYLPGSQHARRQTTKSVLDVTLNLPIVLDDDEALFIAYVHLYSAWFERLQFTLKVQNKYRYLEPNDVIVARGRRLRIVQMTYGADGIITIDGVAASKEIYQQGATGGTSSGQPSSDPPIPQDTDLICGDWPLIADPSEQQVWFPAMAGSDRRSWPGALLEKSVDNGVTWTSVVTNPGPGDTFGACLTTLGDFGGGNIPDEGNAVTVKVSPGGSDLQSYSDDQWMNGSGLCVIGRELVYARNAVQTDTQTYVLSGLLRYQNGTDEGIRPPHAANEVFCKLPTKLTVDALWADYGAARLYRATTIGTVAGTLPAPGGTPGSGSGGSGAPTPPAGSVVVPVLWGPDTARVFSGSIDADVLVIFKFTTGSVSSGASLPRISAAEWASPPLDRTGVLSDTPGSMTGLIDPTTGLPYPGATSEATTVTAAFAVGSGQNVFFGYAYPSLRLNTTYYFNVMTNAGTTTQLACDLTGTGAL